jgi:pimeloyl-ACP methyl ester carboxylesterase
MTRPTWILLRGLGRESGHWGPFVPALAAALPEARIVTLDLPGTGSRLQERAPRTIGENVERLREAPELREARGSPTFLFGLSFGGMVAMDWGARHGEELAGIIVAASSSSDVAPLWKRFSPGGFYGLVLGLIDPDPRRRHGRMADLILNRDDVRAEAVRLWVQIERTRPITRDTLRAQMLAAGAWRAPSAISRPLRFLVGANDRLVHPDCSRRLARRYGAPLSTHREAGHDLTTDATGWAVEEVVRFQNETRMQV